MKKKILIISFIIVVILGIILSAIIYADTGTSIYVNLTKVNSSNIGYAIGDPGPTGGGEYIWNINTYDSKTATELSVQQRNLYCLKAGYGNTWTTESKPQEKVEYNLSYDLQKQRQEVLDKLKAAGTEANDKDNAVNDLLNPGKYYEEILWILDNMYIPGQSDKNEFLAKIGLIYDSSAGVYYYEPVEGYDYSDMAADGIMFGYENGLTDEDIKAVQKAVIWYYTNYKTNNEETFNLVGKAAWLNITTNGTNYTQLMDLEEGRDTQARIVYRYLVEAATNNANQYTSSNNYASPNGASVNTSNLVQDENGKYIISTKKVGTNDIYGPIVINKDGNKEYNIAIKVTDQEGKEITTSEYTFTDSNGDSLGNVTLKDLVGRTEGFYISVSRARTKKVNIKINITQEIAKKTLWLRGTETTDKITLEAEQPIVEVQSETKQDTVEFYAEVKEFDLALRKYITKVNGTDVTNTREPNINQDTLQTGTTATYKHRKEPVLVKNGDTVTYRITIYNEGEKNGYATQITDQLPTGLKYTGGSTITSNKNTYAVTYNSTTNVVTFKATTNASLNKYTNNTLDSETLEFTCEVTAMPDTSNDKILTNVAWISGAYDSEAGEEIINVGDDRDSRPQTSPSVDKDNIENYKGNSNNKTDLADSGYFYEGEQDDDDFEKLKLEPETEITVTKEWNDNNNQDGIRPKQINVNLLADGAQVDGKTATLNENNNWTYTFENLPLKSNGTAINYSITESSEVSGYDTAINEFTITNTHVPEKTQISVEKKWEDSNNQDGIRPTSVTINLLADGTQVDGKTIILNNTNNWKHIFTDLPVYANGTKINYTITETGLPNDNTYTAEITGNATDGYIITNRHTPETTEIIVQKRWEDNNNQDQIRPTEITVRLLAKGVPVEGKEIKLNNENNWKYTFTNLPKNESGKVIEYTVEETTVPEGYEKSVEGNMQTGFTITNTHTPEVTQVSVEKKWEDANNQDGKRPIEITVTLLANGTEVEGKTVKLNDANSWKYTFTNLPKKLAGTDINYTVVETGIPTGYESQTQGDMATGYVITNTYIPEKREISAKKIWEDNNNQDGIRPNSIEIILKANGTEVQRITLTGQGNEWTHTFSNLPKYSNGTEIIYTVEESGIPQGYESLATGNMLTGFTITNTYTPGKTTVKVTKVWEDNNNQDGIRPNSVSVSLLANGVVIDGKTIELNESNNWTYTYTDLPLKQNGENIQYTIVENTTIEGYTTEITNNKVTSSAGEIQTTSAPEYVITNTHETDTTSVTVNKVWADENNQDGTRPSSIIVVLLANGEQSQEITLDANNNWTHIFENLPTKENGTDIIYTVKEKTVPQGYTENITTNSSNNYTITNTHVPEKIFDLALRKYITKINNNELTTLGLTTRVPNISESTLQTGTTATYRHKKDPIRVETNDIITYSITIYNEGEKAGYASQIIDQLPTGLIYNPSSAIVSKDPTGADKNTYEVTYESSTNKITFDIVNSTENPAKELQPYTSNLDYETLEIKCKVVHKAQSGEQNILTNVAWISGAYDTEENKVAVDRDSQPENGPKVNKDNMADYKGNTTNKDDLTDKDNFYKGEQDDDDFEKIQVKTFDLSLRKFVAQVNEEKQQREPEVDVIPLVQGTSTTAIYNHSKKPVSLKPGDLVIYTIRVYNEGETDGYANEVKDYLPPYLEYVTNSKINTKYGWSISTDGRIATTTYLSNKEISAFNGQTLDYEDIQIECKVSNNAIPSQNITNIAEISEYKYGDTVVPEDIDSSSDNIDEDLPEDKDLPDYKKDEQDKPYVPGNEDDDDFEKVYIKEFDLALRKFITKVQDKEITTRIPQPKLENGQIRYEHTKDPITLHVDDVVTYTIRIYNEGEIDGYASEITDDIPKYLEYLPENSTNVEYMWKMYDENGTETEDVEKAVKVKTEYLSKYNGEGNLLKAFDGTTLSYKDIKIAFKVEDPNSNTYIITNHAQISDDTDEQGKPITDKDSEPDEWNEGEDDQDIENVKVEYFDLALLKFVSKVIVIEDGKEQITETGYNGLEDPEPVVKVELHRKKLSNVVVKFGYGITITNQGDIPGYATEITDYIPEGLRFEATDNPNWKDEGNNVISTRQLEGKLLQPGESATVEVILTWINGAENLALKTNTAEISEDKNEYDVPDKDSTPDNKKEGEDDIDIAKVILSIATGAGKTYFTLTLGLLLIVGLGIFGIKKFIL